VKLHLDSGATRMNGESLEFEILNSSFVHYHISEPNLVRIGTGGVDHRAAFHALASRSYPNWVSIEMRQAEPELETLDAALRMVVESMA
jgi:sugar phosphate isomerase/epimerase